MKHFVEGDVWATYGPPILKIMRIDGDFIEWERINEIGSQKFKTGRCRKRNFAVMAREQIHS